MSIKFQVAAALATAGIAASVATPLTLVSKNSAYNLPFSKTTIQKVVEDAEKVYKQKEKTEKFGDIFSSEKVEQFEQLISKIKLKKNERQEEIITLSKDDRELLSSFYAVYSLLDKRKTVISAELHDRENYGTWFENVKAEIALSALGELNGDSEEVSFREFQGGSEDKNSLFNYFYEDISGFREKLGKLKEVSTEELKREVVFDIAGGLIKEMEEIHKNYFLT